MKKFYATIVLIFICGVVLEVYAQEEQIWQFENAKVENSNSSNQQAASTNQSISSGELLAYYQQNGQQTEGEGQTEKLPIQPLPFENQEAREESTRQETPPAFFVPQLPEGSREVTSDETNTLPQVPATKEPAKEEESVLSFNFLYMLIQKFKLSEIME